MNHVALRLRVLAGLGLVLLFVRPLAAATPGSGTITEASPTLSYSGGPFTTSNPTPTPVNTAPICNAALACDNFTLTVDLPAGYQALHPDHYVAVAVDWHSPLGDTLRADLDLWVYKGGTMFTNSASGNQPEIAYLPAVSGTYTLRVVPFHATGEGYTATVTLGPLPATGIGEGLYKASSDLWSRNLHLTGGDHDADLEPAVRFDPDGNAFVASNGPDGSGLWKIADACGQASAQFMTPEAPLINGGGDVDVEVAPQKNALGFYNIYTSSLHALDALANFNSSVSMDGGQTFVTTPLSTANVVDDRQWNAAYGASTVYLSYHSVSGGFNIYVVRSDANGLPGTFHGPYLVNADRVTTTVLNNSLGTLVVDKRPLPPLSPPTLAGPNGEGTLYHGFVEGGNRVFVGVSRDFGVTWTSRLAWEGPRGTNYACMFSCVCVDPAGNVYTAFCDNRNIYYCWSADHGETWSRPLRVSNGPATKVAVFPALAVGSPGHLVFAWYGAQGRNIDDPDNQWQVFTARCQNALDPMPVFEQTVVSDHIVHLGRVCEQGTNCSNGRELLDLFEMDVDPVDGSSLLTYTNDTGGRGTIIARQISGASSVVGKSVIDRSLSCPPNLACPAITLTPPESGELTAGNRRALSFVLTNDGASAGRFQYDLADAQGWTASSSAPLAGVTPALGAGESFTLDVEAQAPASCSPAAQVYTFSAAGASGGCATDTATTSLACEQALAVGPLSGGFGLGAAVPNPFGAATRLAFQIPTRERVRIDVFSVAGRRVRTLLDGVRDAGVGSVAFDAAGLASGIYMVRLEAGGRSELRRVTLMR